MDLGGTFAVFFTVGIVLMMLFCLLLKCYDHRLQKRRQKASRMYDINDQIYKSSEDVMQGAYEQFCKRRELSNQKEMNKKLIVQDMLIEMPQIKKMLNVSNSIYGLSNLRQKLNADISPMNGETNRSLVSMKSFNFERLNTMQSHKLNSTDDNTDRKRFQFVNKLMRLSRMGLTTIDVCVQSLRKQKQGIKLNKTVEQTVITSQDQKFQDLLQINGFQNLNKGYCKFITSVDITNIKQNQIHTFSKLNSITNKQEISEGQYLKCYQYIYRQM